MKRTGWLWTAALCGALLAGNAWAAPIRLTFSILFPQTHAHGKAAEAFAKEVEKRSDGKVAITCFFGGTLTKGPQAYDGVVKGISDMALSVFAYTPGRFPAMEAVDLPMGYPNGLVASRVAHEFAKTVNPKELQDTKVLYIHAHGPGVFMTKAPVRAMADLKGMKIRAPGGVTEVISVLGGVPVAMPMPEAYEALQKGVVQGILSPAEVLKGWKLAEVVNDVLLTDAVGYTNAEFVVMNLNKWKSLPPDVQKIFEDVSAQWTDVHGRAWDQIEKEGIEYAKSLKKTVNKLAPEEEAKWEAAMRPVIESYAAKVPNGAGYVQKVRELKDKYSKQP